MQQLAIPLSIVDESLSKAPGAKCWACPLMNEPFVPTYVPEEYDGVVFLAEAPGEVETKTGRGFTGRSGRLLYDEYKRVGGQWGAACRTNSVLCRPPGNRNPTAEELECCRPRLQQELDQIADQTKVLTVMGKIAEEQVEGLRLPDHVRVVNSVHPAFVLRKPAGMAQLQSALRRVIHGEDPLRETLLGKPEVTVITKLSGPGGLREILESFADNTWISFDLESNNVNRYDLMFPDKRGYRKADPILCLAFTDSLDHGWIIPDWLLYDCPAALPVINRWFARMRTVAHNGNFDLLFLHQIGIIAHVDLDTIALHYCVDPKTKVMKSDLTWISAEDIQIGDGLVGFDEAYPGNIQPSKVLATKRQVAPCYRITLEDGEVVCSAHHRWPVVRTNDNGGQRKFKWYTTEELANPHKLATKDRFLLKFCSPWEVEDSRDAGYVAGILDGEGTIAEPRGTLLFAQKSGKVLDRTIEILENRGFKLNKYIRREGVTCVAIGRGDGYREELRAVGMFRPERLMQKAIDHLWGPKKCSLSRIVSIEYLGEQEVIGIETTTGTFIAEGYLSHNCLNETPGTHGLKELGSSIFGIPDYETNLVQKYLTNRNDEYSKVPEKYLYEYAVRDVCLTLALAKRLKARAIKQGLFERPFQDLYTPAMKMLAQVELNGVMVDVPHLQWWEATMIRKAKQLRARLAELAGWEVNPNAWMQVRKLLFEQLGLPLTAATRTTKAGSTAAVALKQYKDVEAVKLILEYRTVVKFVSTYIRGLLRNVDVHGRVHTQYLWYGTETGRLSSRNPPLQTIPRGSNMYGEVIKSAFIPAPGCVFVDCDYNQAEVRVMAAVTGDPFLIAICSRDLGIHDEVLISQFGPKENMEPLVYKTLKITVKAFVFGWQYGASKKTLLGVFKNKRQANTFLRKFEEDMPVACRWREVYPVQCKQRGYAESRTGRRRRYGIGVKPTEFINAPIQSGASDCTTRSAIRLTNEGYKVVLLVHDEIVVEVPEAQAEEARLHVEQVMKEEASAIFPEVPWKAEAEIVDRWLDKPSKERTDEWLSALHMTQDEEEALLEQIQEAA